MAPLKWKCEGGMGVWGSLGVRGVWGGIMDMEIDGEGTPTWDNKLQKSGVICRFRCPHINCPEECIEESGRSFRDQLKEHLRAPSPIHQHSHSTRHPVSLNCSTIVDRESQGVTRNIKEAMYIQVNDSSLNRNLDKSQLPHIWDQILQDTPSLQLKSKALHPPTLHMDPPPISVPHNN